MDDRQSSRRCKIVRSCAKATQDRISSFAECHKCILLTCTHVILITETVIAHRRDLAVESERSLIGSRIFIQILSVELILV